MDKEQVLKAKYGSKDKPLKIAEGLEIPCYVLEDGTRVLSGRGMQVALGIKSDSGQIFKNFVLGKKLNPLLTEDVSAAVASPIKFLLPGSASKNLKTVALGYEASILPKICNAIIDAYDEGNLTTPREIAIYKQAMVLIRAFAYVGIIALIDEVTGYQEVREKDALSKIMTLYIGKEFLKWEKRFPDEFYKQIFRLRSWDVNTINKKPSVIGKWTTDFIYKHIGHPDIIDKIKELMPRTKGGNYIKKLHQLFTNEQGVPHLEKHITKVITIMQLSRNRSDFERNFARVFPSPDKVVQEALPGFE